MNSVLSKECTINFQLVILEHFSPSLGRLFCLLRSETQGCMCFLHLDRHKSQSDISMLSFIIFPTGVIQTFDLNSCLQLLKIDLSLMTELADQNAKEKYF